MTFIFTGRSSMMPRPSKPPCILLVALAIMAGIVGANRLDAAHRLLPIAEDLLASVTGMDPHKITAYSKTCAELQAQRYVNAVPSTGCTAANAGTRTACVDCNSSYANVQIYPTIISGQQPPGLTDPVAVVTCGREVLGVCKMVNNVPTCADQGQTANDCPAITEYNNQPPG